MEERSTSPHTQTNTPTVTYSSCVDINGKIQPHGEYYTPAGRPCSQCPCSNGQAGICIMVSCQKPKCRKYKQVSGKCCDYKCHDNIDFTDKATLAIVISLSVILVFTLIAIILVLRKMRRKKQFGERLSSVSLNSQTQQPEETDIDDIIQRNSIPNNLRHQIPVQVLSSCSYSACPKLNNTKAMNVDNCELSLSNDLQNYSSEISCNSACDNDIDIDSSQSSDDSSSNQSIKVRHFDPPSLRSYTPLSSTAFI